jgi:hypothetical protein
VPLRVAVCVLPDNRFPLHATDSLRRTDFSRDILASGCEGGEPAASARPSPRQLDESYRQE